MAFRMQCGILAACLACTSPSWGQEPAEPAQPAPVAGQARGYVGLALEIARSEYSSPLVPDIEADGGGLGVKGVAHSGKVSPSLDIALSGQAVLMKRTFDQTDEDVGDFLYELDGGLRIYEIVYASLGVHSLTTAYENPDIATTYTVVPLGVGVLLTDDTGYFLGQLRIGGGRLGNDQNDDTERVNYAGLRLVMQRGFGPGVQFLLGLGWDWYEFKESNDADQYVRLEAGLGFGL